MCAKSWGDTAMRRLLVKDGFTEQVTLDLEEG